MKIVYIAGPFRSSNPDGKSNAWGVQQNVMRAMARALEVWRRGHAAVCPHSNTMFFQDADGCVDAVWLDGDIEILRRCDAVLTVEGWRQSKGATKEVELAKRWGKPVLETVDELERYLERTSEPGSVSRLSVEPGRVAELWSTAVRNAAATSMPDVQTFAQLLLDEVRPSVLDMVTHAREDGWKAAVEARS